MPSCRRTFATDVHAAKHQSRSPARAFEREFDCFAMCLRFGFHNFRKAIAGFGEADARQTHHAAPLVVGEDFLNDVGEALRIARAAQAGDAVVNDFAKALGISNDARAATRHGFDEFEGLAFERGCVNEDVARGHARQLVFVSCFGNELDGSLEFRCESFERFAVRAIAHDFKHDLRISFAEHRNGLNERVDARASDERAGVQQQALDAFLTQLALDNGRGVIGHNSRVRRVKRVAPGEITDHDGRGADQHVADLADCALFGAAENGFFGVRTGFVGDETCPGFGGTSDKRGDDAAAAEFVNEVDAVEGAADFAHAADDRLDIAQRSGDALGEHGCGDGVGLGFCFENDGNAILQRLWNDLAENFEFFCIARAGDDDAWIVLKHRVHQRPFAAKRARGAVARERAARRKQPNQSISNRRTHMRSAYADKGVIGRCGGRNQ